MRAGYGDRVRTRSDVLSAPDALAELANAGIEAFAPEVSIQPVGAAVPAFSEDSGSFQALTPGVMDFLGVGNPEGGADDAAIAVGTRATAMLARLTED